MPAALAPRIDLPRPAHGHEPLEAVEAAGFEALNRDLPEGTDTFGPEPVETAPENPAPGALVRRAPDPNIRSCRCSMHPPGLPAHPGCRLQVPPFRGADDRVRPGGLDSKIPPRTTWGDADGPLHSFQALAEALPVSVHGVRPLPSAAKAPRSRPPRPPPPRLCDRVAPASLPEQSRLVRPTTPGFLQRPASPAYTEHSGPRRGSKHIAGADVLGRRMRSRTPLATSHSARARLRESRLSAGIVAVPAASAFWT